MLGHIIFGQSLRHHVLEGESLIEAFDVMLVEIATAAPTHDFVLLDKQLHQCLFDLKLFEKEHALW